MISTRICLITPPALFLTTERVFMSLGILRIAAVLEHAGYNVDMLDLSGIENYLDVMDDYLEVSGVTVFGISATTPQIPVAVKICNRIHEKKPMAKVILGGAHVTAVNAAWREEDRCGGFGRAIDAMAKLCDVFDVLVAGDGEEAIIVAMDYDSPKIIDADDKDSCMFMDEHRIDRLPIPARHLVDVSSYTYMLDGVKALSLVGQQGCPYKCGFCGGRASPSMRCVRARSVENVIDEIEYLYRIYDVRGFMLYDDELNLKDERLLELMSKLASIQKYVGQEFRFRGFVRSNLFTDKQAEAMYEAGFRWIIVGFESGSQRMLDNMDKQATVEDNTECMKIAKRNGLKVKAAMSIGHPGESTETVGETMDWLLAMQPDSIDVSIITPYPGSLYYNQAVKFVGSIDGCEDIWVYTSKKHKDKLYMHNVDYTTVEQYYKGVPGEYKSYVFTDDLSEKDLVELRDDIATIIQASLGLPDLEMGFTRYDRSVCRLPSNIFRSTW